MDLAWTIVVGLILGAWFAASVIHQVAPRWWRSFNTFDRLRLLPQWRFFAPRPGRHDHHLVIRDIVESVPTPWRQIDIGSSPPAIRWLVNPCRFRQKALSDYISTLLAARRALETPDGGASAAMLSLPYLAILSWVVAQPAAIRPCSRQFAVVATTGHGQRRELRIIYISETHSLEDGRDG